MGEIMKSGQEFLGYEYLSAKVPTTVACYVVDGYRNFGWIMEEDPAIHKRGKYIQLQFKRDRRIKNKVELTRLQRNFDACMSELKSLEQSKTTAALIVALAVALIGTAFMACSVFAVTSEPPHILPCVLFAVPAFLGWGSPYFIYKKLSNQKIKKLTPLIEAKTEEIYDLCEKGYRLLPQ